MLALYVVVDGALLLFVLSIGLIVCGWYWWSKLPEKFWVPKGRSEAGFSGLVSGTLSTMMFAGLLFWPFHVSDSIREDLIRIGWGLASLTLVLSPFDRGKVRIAELLIGLAMSPVYWVTYDLRNFSYV